MQSNLELPLPRQATPTPQKAVQVSRARGDGLVVANRYLEARRALWRPWGVAPGGGAKSYVRVVVDGLVCLCVIGKNESFSLSTV